MPLGTMFWKLRGGGTFQINPGPGGKGKLYLKLHRAYTLRDGADVNTVNIASGELLYCEDETGVVPRGTIPTRR